MNMSKLLNILFWTMLVLICFVWGFDLLVLIAPVIAFLFEHCNDFHFMGDPSISDIVTKEYLYDINLFSEGKNGDQPDNFMDLESSSEQVAGESTGNNKDENKVIDMNKLQEASDINEKLNPPSGATQSSKIPQTEFEEKPYLENAPLPKSQSDPTSLGKNK